MSRWDCIYYKDYLKNLFLKEKDQYISKLCTETDRNHDESREIIQKLKDEIKNLTVKLEVSEKKTTKNIETLEIYEKNQIRYVLFDDTFFFKMT